MDNGRVRVFVADDWEVCREGVLRAISEHPELELVGQAEGGGDAVAAIVRLKPDVVVLGIGLPQVEGTRLIEQATSRGLELGVVALAPVPATVAAGALPPGTVAHLPKTVRKRAMCDAIVAAARGDTELATEIGAAEAAQLERTAAVLTPREREILTLMADGRSAPKIAECLYLSPTTVRTHVRNLYRKLAVSDRAAAVAQGIRRGVIA